MSYFNVTLGINSYRCMNVTCMNLQESLGYHKLNTKKNIRIIDKISISQIVPKVLLFQTKPFVWLKMLPQLTLRLHNSPHAKLITNTIFIDPSPCICLRVILMLYLPDRTLTARAAPFAELTRSQICSRRKTCPSAALDNGSRRKNENETKRETR